MLLVERRRGRSFVACLASQLRWIIKRNKGLKRSLSRPKEAPGIRDSGASEIQRPPNRWKRYVVRYENQCWPVFSWCRSSFVCASASNRFFSSVRLCYKNSKVVFKNYVLEGIRYVWKSFILLNNTTTFQTALFCPI